VELYEFLCVLIDFFMDLYMDFMDLYGFLCFLMFMDFYGVLYWRCGLHWAHSN